MTTASTGPHELMRQALHLVQLGERTVETRYTTLFAALETVVLWYRKKEGLELILHGAAWKRVKKGVTAFLREHEDLQGSEREERRELICSKVLELNRVPFAAAWKAFCRDYSIETADLWSLESTDSGVSLTGIRNRIVHGQVVLERHIGPLSGACDHLRWTVERALLGVLGWPLGRSHVRPGYLRTMTAMADLAKDRAAMTERGRAADDSP